MNHTDEIELGKVLPGVDLALWLQLVVAAVVLAVAGGFALSAL